MRDRLQLLLIAWTFGTVVSCHRKEAQVPPSDMNRDMPREILTQRKGRLITEGGVGEVKLGLSLVELKALFPRASFMPQSDGDGAPLFIFSSQVDDTLFLYFKETDASDAELASPILQAIETFSRLDTTLQGIAAGDPISFVEKKLGPVQIITQSEIESREFAAFERQPAGFQFRIDYTGIFPEGSRHTRDHDPQGRILSITTRSAHELGDEN